VTGSPLPVWTGFDGLMAAHSISLCLKCEPESAQPGNRGTLWPAQLGARRRLNAVGNLSPEREPATMRRVSGGARLLSVERLEELTG